MEEKRLSNNTAGRTNNVVDISHALSNRRIYRYLAEVDHGLLTIVVQLSHIQTIDYGQTLESINCVELGGYELHAHAHAYNSFIDSEICLLNCSTDKLKIESLFAKLSQTKIWLIKGELSIVEGAVTIYDPEYISVPDKLIKLLNRTYGFAPV